MKPRLCIFAVVVDERNKLLILHRMLNWKGWEVPKGGIDKSHSEKQAVMQELREEAGLAGKDIVSATRTNYFMSYDYPKKYRVKWKVKGAKFRGWLVRVKAKRKISIAHNPDREHDKYKWVPLAKALKMLTFANQRSAVKKIAKSAGL